MKRHRARRRPDRQEGTPTAGSYSKTTLIGYVAREPEQRVTPGGVTVTSFSIPVNNKRGDEEITTWYRVSAFGKLGETCAAYLQKGSYVYVEGTEMLREYQDRDGNTRSSLELNAREMRMLDRRTAQDDGPSSDSPF